LIFRAVMDCGGKYGAAIISRASARLDGLLAHLTVHGVKERGIPSQDVA